MGAEGTPKRNGRCFHEPSTTKDSGWSFPCPTESLLLSRTGDVAVPLGDVLSSLYKNEASSSGPPMGPNDVRLRYSCKGTLPAAMLCEPAQNKNARATKKKPTTKFYNTFEKRFFGGGPKSALLFLCWLLFLVGKTKQKRRKCLTRKVRKQLAFSGEIRTLPIQTDNCGSKHWEEVFIQPKNKYVHAVGGMGFPNTLIWQGRQWLRQRIC